MIFDNIWYVRIVIVITFLVSSCSNEAEPEYPFGGPIPDRDIVYMPDQGPHENGNLTSNPSFGFINANGSEKIEYYFPVFAGTDIEIYQACEPRWSWDGNSLVFYVKDWGANTRLIDSEGKMFGSDCADINKANTFGKNGYVLDKIDDDNPLFIKYNGNQENTLIARYDLQSCQVVSVFTLPIPSDENLGDIHETPNGILAANLYSKKQIILFNSTNENIEILEGYHPSLTEDGTLLAYFNYIGALVVRDISSGVEKNFGSVIPFPLERYKSSISMPGWSPDHEWLVYNTAEGEIYKININTGEKVFLTMGWAPDWR